MVNTIDKHYWTKAEVYLAFFLQYLKNSTWFNIFKKNIAIFIIFYMENNWDVPIFSL